MVQGESWCEGGAGSSQPRSSVRLTDPGGFWMLCPNATGWSGLMTKSGKGKNL